VVSRGGGTSFTAGYAPVVAGRDGAPAGSPPIAVGKWSPVLDDAQPATSIRLASSRGAQSPAAKGGSGGRLELVLLKSDTPAETRVSCPKPEVIQLIGRCWRQYDQSEMNSPLKHLRVWFPAQRARPMMRLAGVRSKVHVRCRQMQGGAASLPHPPEAVS
jgi:hypothetical protein